MVHSNTTGKKVMLNFPKIVVCGTDTDVGKTLISTLLVQGLNATYWKPIQSGIQDGGDTSFVCQTLKLPQERFLSEAYRLQAPVSPHWAAEQDSQWIDPKCLAIPCVKNTLVIETAGGLMVPLNRKWLQIDQIKEWGQPIILVARSGLGTLNHTLLSIEAAKKRNIPLIGLILNGPVHQDNPKTLEQFGGIPVIAQIPRLEKISPRSLANEWEKQNMKSKFNDLIERNF